MCNGGVLLIALVNGIWVCFMLDKNNRIENRIKKLARAHQRNGFSHSIIACLVTLSKLGHAI